MKLLNCHHPKFGRNSNGSMKREPARMHICRAVDFCMINYCKFYLWIKYDNLAGHQEFFIELLLILDVFLYGSSHLDCIFSKDRQEHVVAFLQSSSFNQILYLKFGTC